MRATFASLGTIAVARAGLSVSDRRKRISTVRYRIEISEKARAQLRALPRDVRRAIGYRMEMMCDDLHGDITKLRDKGNRYRLRIGTYRVLFVLAADAIHIYAVKDRKEAYD